MLRTAATAIAMPPAVHSGATPSFDEPVPVASAGAVGGPCGNGCACESVLRALVFVCQQLVWTNHFWLERHWSQPLHHRRPLRHAFV